MVATSLSEKLRDPLKVAANSYNLLFQDNRVRVSNLLIKPGDTAPMHWHPYHVVYSFGNGRLRLTTADKKSNEIAVKPGDVVAMPSGSHEAVNIGSTDFHALVIEMKGVE